MGRKSSKDDKKGFSDEIAGSLDKNEWWNLEDAELEKYADVMNAPTAFLDAIQWAGQ